MERLADVLVQAIDAAIARHPGMSWVGLSFRSQADAIDFEVRRIEAERDAIGLSAGSKARPQISAE